MKDLKSFLLGIMLLTSIMIFGQLSVTSYAITNGQSDGNNHPYVCLIVFDNTPGHPAWRTTGVLISPTVVLTAGHGTYGAVAARVYFQEKVYPATPSTGYPYAGGITAASFYTNPDYRIVGGPGLPGFDYHDVGVVILSEPVTDKGYGALPTAGLVDTLPLMTGVDLVGYGVQYQVRGGGLGPMDSWRGNAWRMYAPAATLNSENTLSGEFLRLTANPARGKGGIAFGDSGGPILLAGTNTILALNSFVPNSNCAGVTYAQRLDLPDILAWIGSF